MTLKTLAEDSAVSGEENDSFKWSLLEVLYFTPQFKLHLSSLSLLLTQFDLLTSSRSDRRPFDQFACFGPHRRRAGAEAAMPHPCISR